MTMNQALELNHLNGDLLQAIFDRNPDGVIVTDDDCTCVEANAAACDLIGLSRSEFIGRSVTDFIELRCSLVQDGQNLVPTEITRAQCHLHRADGSMREVEYAVAVGFFPNLHLLTLRDSSELQPIGAELLHQSEERFLHLVETSSDWVWEINENRVYTYCSPKVASIVGYEPREIVGKTAFELMPEREGNRIARAFKMLASNHKPFYNLESLHIHKNGHITVVETSGVPIFDLDGGFRGYRGISRDITDHKRVEKSLREREQQIASITNNISCSIYRLVVSADRAMELPFISTGLFEITGISPELVMSEPQKLFDLIHPEDRERCDRVFQAAIASLQPFTNEFRLISVLGQVKWVRDSARLSQLDTGDIIIDGVLIDISDRKQAEEALRKSENDLQDRTLQLQKVIETVGEGITLSDATGRFSIFNSQMQEITGYTMEEANNHNDFARLLYPKPENYRQAIAKLEEVKRLGEVRNFETTIQTKLGQSKTLLISSSIMHDGMKAMFLSTYRDISDRKQAEAVMTDLAAIVKFSDDAIIGMTLNGTITSWNLGAQFIYGYTPQEAVGKNIISLLVPRGEVVGISGPNSKAAQDIISYYTTPHVRKDGKVIEVLMTISPVKDAFGNITGSSVIARDISDRRAVERMKDEFISIVSHELRTPLTSIHGALRLLLSGNLGKLESQGQRMLEIASKNTDRLVRLTNDILDLESLESGKVKLSERNCNIADLIDQVVQEMQPMADIAGITLSASTISAPILADSDRIIQVLTNLLSNSIKFSPCGSQIKLHAALVKDRSLLPPDTRDAILAGDREQPTLLITVQDYGRGIPSDKLNSIFERFQQVDASDSRQKGGTGLGLAICRSIVQQHGGRIWAESVVGEGSTFFLCMPIISLPPPLELPLPNLDTHKEIRVLVDERLLFSNNALKNVLKQKNCHIVPVASGQDLVTLAQTQNPTAILIDLCLPDMNAWETVQALKQDAATGTIPIVIFSAMHLAKYDADLSNVVGWVTTSVNTAELEASLATAFGDQNNSCQVLVVEDDPDLAKFLMTIFERHDIETLYAQTGMQAIKFCQSHIPNLIVLDLSLPEVDGFTIVEWLRQHHHLADIPLVVYTGRELDDEARSHLQLGQTEFVTKSQISAEELESKVMSLLNCYIPS